jgi:hypothetical protein
VSRERRDGAYDRRRYHGGGGYRYLVGGPVKSSELMRLYKNKYLGEWDLWDAREGRHREITFVIDRIVLEDLIREGGEKDSKPVLYLKTKDGKPWHVPAVLTKRNAKTFRSTLEPNEDWEGRTITFFVEQRKNFGVMQPTLSVRGKSQRTEALKATMAAPAAKQDVSREPGEEG